MSSPNRTCDEGVRAAGPPAVLTETNDPGIAAGVVSPPACFLRSLLEHLAVLLLVLARVAVVALAAGLPGTAVIATNRGVGHRLFMATGERFHTEPCR